MLIFTARLALGLVIATASYVIGAKFPEWAWWCGWIGAITYYSVVALPKGWNK